jgi:hypothetical protein
MKETQPDTAASIMILLEKTRDTFNPTQVGGILRKRKITFHRKRQEKPIQGKLESIFNILKV